MVLLTLYSVFIVGVTVYFYRYSFPYPWKEYQALFLLLFGLGFLTHFYNRSWGRFWIVVGSLVFVRVGAILGIQPTIPEWTTLHPLFLGGILGILSKEIFIFRTKIGQDRIQAALVHLALVFFLLVLGIERFLEYHKTWNWEGIYLKEQFYYPRLSSRQAFQLCWMVLDNLIPVISYFAVEEAFRRDTENALVDYKKGLATAFLIQFLILTIQTYLQPTAIMEATGESLKNGRVAGLFKDSGSASWIFPSMGVYLFYEIRKKKGSIPELKRKFLLGSIALLLFLAGVRLGRTYWIILFAFFIVWLVFFMKEILGKYSFSIRLSLGILGVLLGFAGLFAILEWGNLQTKIPSIQRISQEWKAFRNGTPIETIDQRRIRLIQVSWEFFLDSPVFGKGLGATIVELKRPKSPWKNLPEGGFVDSPSNFFVGWLGETGVLGTFVFFSYVGMMVWIRKTYFPAFLLILPFLFGYQIVHPDGGFFVLFILLGLIPYERVQWMYGSAIKLRYLWFILSVGIALHYLVLGLLKNS